jgi:NADH-quinone oxidoreductase subunit J
VEGASVTSRILFDLFAAVAVLFSALMVVGRHPVRSVLSLVVAFFGLAACYVMLGAPFIGALQVIVYAGAILVLFLFVLMLLNIGRPPVERGGRPVQALLGSLGTVAFAAMLLGVLRSSGAALPAAAPVPPDPSSLGEPAALARVLFGDYLLHFEAISVLLLAALVGAFVLARRESRT